MTILVHKIHTKNLWFQGHIKTYGSDYKPMVQMPPKTYGSNDRLRSKTVHGNNVLIQNETIEMLWGLLSRAR